MEYTNGYTNAQNWHFVCHCYSGRTFLHEIVLVEMFEMRKI